MTMKTQIRTRTYRTGYIVWLYGEKFWHRTLEGAARRATKALNYCQGENNQVVRVHDAQRMM